MNHQSPLTPQGTGSESVIVIQAREIERLTRKLTVLQEIVGKLKQYRVSQAQSHKFILLDSNPAFDVGFVKIIDNFRVFGENIGTCRLADLLEKN